MEEVFRPRKLDLFTFLILPVLIVGGIGYQITEGYPMWILVVVILPSVYMVVEGIYLARSYILLNDEKINCKLKRMEFELEWKDVVALSAISLQNPPQNYSFIILGTTGKNWELRVDSFDGKRLWESIKSKVSLDALEPDAFKKTGEYQKLLASQNKLVDVTLRLGAHWFYKLTAWGILALALLLTLIAWRIAQDENLSMNNLNTIILAGGGILGMVGCFLLLWLTRSFILATPNEIKVVSALGKYKIFWSELEQIELTPGPSAIAFYGNNKRLVVLLEACGFSDRAKFVDKVVQHAKQKNIEPKQVKSLPRTQLNTRLTKGESF